MPARCVPCQRGAALREGPPHVHRTPAGENSCGGSGARAPWSSASCRCDAATRSYPRSACLARRPPSAPAGLPPAPPLRALSPSGRGAAEAEPRCGTGALLLLCAKAALTPLRAPRSLNKAVAAPRPSVASPLASRQLRRCVARSPGAGEGASSYAAPALAAPARARPGRLRCAPQRARPLRGRLVRPSARLCGAFATLPGPQPWQSALHPFLVRLPALSADAQPPPATGVAWPCLRARRSSWSSPAGEPPGGGTNGMARPALCCAPRKAAPATQRVRIARLQPASSGRAAAGGAQSSPCGRRQPRLNAPLQRLGRGPAAPGGLRCSSAGCAGLAGPDELPSLRRPWEISRSRSRSPPRRTQSRAARRCAPSPAQPFDAHPPGRQTRAAA